MWIAEWEWDDGNVSHIAGHGLRPQDIEAVWAGEPKFRRNKKGRAATHQMIGPDDGGAFVAAFVVQVRDGLWRVVTARRATDAEREWWERS